MLLSLIPRIGALWTLTRLSFGGENYPGSPEDIDTGNWHHQHITEQACTNAGFNEPGN
jgi:hypothetical protein